MMMKPYLKQLAAYSAMSAAYIAFHSDIQAQAVYVDIVPNVVLDTPDYTSFFGIDIDSNGLFDFDFFNTSFTVYDHLFQQEMTRRFVFGGVFDTQRNGIVGLARTFTFSSGSSHLYYAYALPAGYSINSNLNFEFGNYQRMAGWIYGYTTTFPYLDIIDLRLSKGYWFPETTDHYLGIKFNDVADRLHYGWIRCDVLDSGRVLVIKDYAYQNKPDFGIKAGDMVGDTTVAIHNLQSTAASIYAFNKSVYIHLPTLPEPNTEVVVYDMLGRELYRQGIETTSTQIPLNTAAGIYLVTIQDKEGRYSKKVLVE